MSNRSVYAFAGLLLLIIIGMLIGSFRLVIYPYVLVIGLMITAGLVKKLKVNKKLLLIPTISTIIFFILLLSLDLATLTSPIGNGKLILGIPLSTAIYYFGIWLLSFSFSLIYAWSFNLPEEKQSTVDINSLDM